MAIRKILKYPDPFLRRAVDPIDFNSPDWNDISEGMFLDNAVDDALDTLYGVDKGAAIAANQIGLSHRFFVINKNQKTPDGMPLLIINPRVISSGSEFSVEQEGCLSFPGISVPVRRPVDVRVGFHRIDGGTEEMDLSGWIGRVFQHETDHLDGKLFVDALSSKKKINIANTIRRMK